MLKIHIFFLSLLLFTAIIFTPSAFAQQSPGCVRVDNTASCPSDRTYRRPYDFNFKTGPSENPFNSVDPQCTHPIVASGTPVTMCCSSPTEANSVDSIRAPLCGGSIELGHSNSVCWSCGGGGNVYCSGGSFTLAGSSPVLEQHRNDGFYELSQAEKQALGSTFIFNGIEYQMPGGALGICGSNVEACLVDSHNQCTNRALEDGSTPNNTLPAPTPPTPEEYNEAKKIQDELVGPKGNPGPPEKIQGLSGKVASIIGVEGGRLRFLGDAVTLNRISRVRYERDEYKVRFPEKLRQISLKLNKFAFRLLGDLKQAQAQKYEFFEGTPNDAEKAALNNVPSMTGFRYCAPKGRITTVDASGNTTVRDNTVLRSVGYVNNATEDDSVTPYWLHKGYTGARQATAMLCGSAARGGTRSSNFYITPDKYLHPIYGIIGEVEGEPVYDTNPVEQDAAYYECGNQSVGTNNRPVKTEPRGIALRDNVPGLVSRFFGGLADNIVVNYLLNDWFGSIFPCDEDSPDSRCFNPERSITSTKGDAGTLWYESALGGLSTRDLNPNAPAEARRLLVEDACGFAGNDETAGGIIKTFYDLKQKKPEVNQHSDAPHKFILSGSNAQTAVQDVQVFGQETTIMADECIRAQISDVKLQERNVEPKCRVNPQDPPIQANSLGQIAISDVPSVITPSSNPLTYAIPYRDSNCNISQTTINNASSIMERYYPSYAAQGTQNLNSMWQEIQQEAVASGWNPSFVLALWIEESAAGGAPGAYGMGCIYHTYSNGAAKTQPGGSQNATREQYQCLFERDFNDFNRFMCTYSGEIRDSQGHCTNFQNNPNFIHNLQFWYNQLSAGQSASCQIQEVTP